MTLGNKTDGELVRDTILLKINVEDHDPILARDIANAIPRVYIEFNISNRLQYSQNTLTWMSDQLYEVKKRLEDAEAEFLAYKQDEKIFSVEGRQKVIDQKIQELPASDRRRSECSFGHVHHRGAFDGDRPGCDGRLCTPSGSGSRRAPSRKQENGLDSRAMA